MLTVFILAAARGRMAPKLNGSFCQLADLAMLLVSFVVITWVAS